MAASEVVQDIEAVHDTVVEVMGRAAVVICQLVLFSVLFLEFWEDVLLLRFWCIYVLSKDDFVMRDVCVMEKPTMTDFSRDG